MKKVISFSLWGDNPKYTIGAVKNVEIAKILYQDWICRFYCGQSVPADIIDKLKSFDNTEVIMMPEMGSWNGMFWRFYACEDSDVMISRDTDSRLTLRERFAVEEWLKSDKSFHILRDFFFHKTSILGGMWGCRNGVLKNIKQLIDNYQKNDQWQVDQNFLAQVVYPIIKNSSMIHDPYHFYPEETVRNFPTPLINRHFVGEVFDENDKRSEHYLMLPP